MALCYLTGRQQHHEVIDAVSKLAEKLRVNVLQYQFMRLYEYIGFFVKVLIKSLHEPLRGSFTLHFTLR